MKKLLFFCGALSFIAIQQQLQAISNPLNLLKGAQERVSAVTKDFTGLVKTVTAEPNLAKQMKDAIEQTIALRAFLACKGKPAGTEIKSKDKLILKCGDFKVPINVIRLYFQIIKDKFIGTAENPGILFAATDLIKAFGLLKGDLIKVPTLLTGLNSSLKSLDEILAELPKTLKIKKSK
jgi:hypothetical protein